MNDSYMDNMLPKLYFGFGNTFTWKNFDLDIFMYGQLGVKKWNDAYSYSADAGNLSRGVDAHNVGIYSYNIWNTQTNMNGHSRVSQSVNQWLYPKIWALIIQEKMPLMCV